MSSNPLIKKKAFQGTVLAIFFFATLKLLYVFDLYTFRTVVIQISQATLFIDISDWCKYQSEYLVNLRSSV